MCIYAGPNVGKYSARILENTRASVIAFEPNPIPFEILLILVAQYTRRFSAYNLGVSDGRSELELFYGVANSNLVTFSPEALHMGDVKNIIR